MITQKKQALKRFTYICLSLSSIVVFSEVQAGKNPPLDSSEDKSGDYRETHNGYARKYGLDHRIIQPRPRYQGPTLVEVAEEFTGSTIKLRKQTEEELREINALGTKVVERGSTIAEVIIDKNVKDEKAKNVLIQLKDDFTGYLKKAFSK